MQISVIRHRVADFLSRCTPFDSVPEQDLLNLAGSGRVKFHESGEYICRRGDVPGRFLWIIQQGRVELFDQAGPGEQLRDVLGEGDVLGLDRFVGDGRCIYSARTASDVILYGVAADLFESFVPRHPAVQRFVAAHASVTGNLTFGRRSWLDQDPPPMEFLRARLVTVSADASRQEALLRLAESDNGAAAVVDPEGRVAAIITPAKVFHSSHGLVSTPPPAAAVRPDTRTAVRAMLRSRAEELAITADGTADSRLEAILTASDLALFCGRNPARLIAAVRRAGSIAEMVPLLGEARKLVIEALAQPQDIDDCCQLGTEVTGAFSEACIRQAHENVTAAGVEPARVPYCWLLFGESARGDGTGPGLPILATVYDDSKGLHSQDSMYFTALAGETMERFQACGLTGPGLVWPEGSQPCMPLSEWRRLFRETVRNPLGHNLYLRREFFDMRILSGDDSIHRSLERQILFELQDHAIAIPLLANDTLANLPPLTFFQGLVLEWDGTQRESFEIEKVALSPIADAARVYALAGRRLSPCGTLERLQSSVQDDPDAAEILLGAAEAFRIALYYRSVAGARIEPGKLGKFDQRLLKTAFSAIHRLLEFTSLRFVPEA
jgi:CBS domain-containing protein